MDVPDLKEEDYNYTKATLVNLSEQEIEHLIAISDSSIISKRSMEMQGYLAYEQSLFCSSPTYLNCVVPTAPKRAPLINRGYWMRYSNVRDYILSFMIGHSRSPMNIVSLGCGYDTTYFTFQHSYDYWDFSWYDIDFPDLIERKKKLIDAHKELRKLTDDPYKRADYFLVGVDLCRLWDLDRKLDLLEMGRTIPTLFISECSITYMPTKAADALIAFTTREFKNPYFLLCEQIVPDDPFGQTMTAHFQQLNSPLQSIHTYPDLKSQEDRFRHLGYKDDICTHTLYDIWQGYINEEEEIEYIDSLEPFDENEDWLLTCQHYFIIMAGHDAERKIDYIRPSFPTKVKEESNIIIQHTRSLQNPLLQRVGHTATLVGDHIVVFAGYKTKELADTIIMSVEGQVLHHIEADKNGPTPRMHHCATADKSGNNLYIFGGRNCLNNVFDDLWKFDLKSHSWSLVNQNNQGPGPRFRSKCKPVEHGMRVDEWIFDFPTAEWSSDPSPTHDEQQEDPLTWRNADRHLRRTWMNNRCQLVHDLRDTKKNRWIAVGGGGCFSFKSWWNDAVMIWNTWNIQEILSELAIYDDRDLHGSRELLPAHNAMNEIEKIVLECVNADHEVPQSELVQIIKDIYSKLDILPSDTAQFYKWKCWSKLKEVLLSVK